MEYSFQSVGPTLSVITLVFLLVFALVLMVCVVGIAALPGWIARRRNHPQAAAINIAGWFGLPTGIVWVLAMVWAYWCPPQAASSGSKDQPLVRLQGQIDQLEATIASIEQLQRGANA